VRCILVNIMQKHAVSIQFWFLSVKYSFMDTHWLHVYDFENGNMHFMQNLVFKYHIKLIIFKLLYNYINIHKLMLMPDNIIPYYNIVPREYETRSTAVIRLDDFKFQWNIPTRKTICKRILIWTTLQTKQQTNVVTYYIGIVWTFFVYARIYMIICFKTNIFS